MIRNEEISWDKTKTAKNTYKTGDEIEVVLIELEKEKERISFSTKRLEKSPVTLYSVTKKAGDIVSGEIIDIKDFGIFIKLAENVDGLIRIEDLGNKKAEEFTTGEVVEAVILFVDEARNRIRLSMKQLARKQEREILKKINDEEERGNDAFKDAFNALKK